MSETNNSYVLVPATKNSYILTSCFRDDHCYENNERNYDLNYDVKRIIWA
jgi:hypothetical protein